MGRPEYLLRKLAHFGEYLLLGLLLYALLRRRSSPVAAAGLALVLAAAFACTDEWHQLSVPGRDGNLRDVLIDSAGAVAGVGLGGPGDPGCAGSFPGGWGRNRHNRKKSRSPVQGNRLFFCRAGYNGRRIATWRTPASRKGADTVS